MRADRLISLLMLLQSRGRLPAHRLAEELEVSERTIYRDIEALSLAGVPVYAERGPRGGCALLESYRSNLTGLTAAEVQALFMLSIPAPLAQLGVSQELKAALLKLSAALPAAHRQEEERSRQRIYLDSTWWFQAEESVPCLPDIQQALWQDRQVKITYRLQFGAEVERVVSPLGLVAKTNVWYLVAGWNSGLRVYRVASITEAQVLDEATERPPDFDLAAFWKDWAEGYEGQRSSFLVTARLAPELVRELPRYFGDGALAALAGAGTPDERGWVTLTLPFEHFYAARDKILGLGAAIEVVEPEALRLSVIDFAEQIVGFYRVGNASPMHYVCTPEQAWQLIQEHEQFWVSNCYCRESRGHCARSRMDVCLIFNDALSGSGTGKKAVSMADVQAILIESRTKHLVPRPYRDDSRTVTDGICFCCDDCCSYFLNPEETCDKGSLVEATNLEACQTCGDCVDVCYFGARSLEPGLVTDQELCYGCGLCVEACPEGAIRMVARE